ncbi:hypothetical protein BGZ63DRAFT_321328, partial [Mariannaea sp. PMI_226]
PAVLAQDSSPGGPVFDGQPANCNAWHTIVSGDTCSSVPALFGITLQQFLEWNPAVSADCLTNFWLTYAYCVGIDKNWSSTSTSATSTRTSSITSTSSSHTESITTTPTQSSTYSTRQPIVTWNITTTDIDVAWPPSHTQAGQPDNCNRWHLVGPLDDCQAVVNRYGTFLTLEDLLAWNPALDDDCSGLYSDYWICIGIRSGAGLTDMIWSTSVTNASPTGEPTSHTSTTFPPINSSFTAEPTQGPMPTGCQAFYQVESGQTCNEVLDIYDYITKEQFFQWNPILNSNCNGLWSGYWYCVAYFPDDDLPMPAHVTTTPSPIPTDSPTDCKSWYYTTIDDTCDDIVLMFGTFSKSDFVAWNPSVYDSCVGIQQETWYCVGKSDTPTTRTSSLPSTTAPTSRPTQTGITSDCTKYWFVSEDDTCSSIARSNGITVANLTSWNAALGSNCAGLTSNYYICVGVT